MVKCAGIELEKSDEGRSEVMSKGRNTKKDIELKLRAVSLILVCVFSLVVGHTSYAQEEKGLRLKSYNLTLSPMYFMRGAPGIGDFHFGVSRRMALGVGVRSDFLSGPDAVGGGFRMNYHLSGMRFTSGWYLSPMIEYLVPTDGTSSSGEFVKASGSIFRVLGLVGYQWVHYSGLNLALGIGLVYSFLDVESDGWKWRNDAPLRGAGELKIGYAF